MKKLIAIAVVLALVAGVAFAQTANGIFVNAWGRAAFTPLKYVGPLQVNGETAKGPDGKDVEGETYAGVGQTWGGSDPRVDFRVGGNSDFVGFKVHIKGERRGFGIGDDAHIWAKPFGSDVLKLTAGHFVVDDLRGKIGNLDGGFSNFVLPNTPEEDPIFSRFGTAGENKGNANNDSEGFLISSAPIDGLFLGLMVTGGFTNASWGGYDTLAALTYQYMQIGAGYNIANIGHIRAQYVGGWSGEKDLTKEDDVKYFDPTSDMGKLARIEAAFALTAVEGLLVDLGAKIWLPLTIKDGPQVSKGLDVSLGANFNSGAFGLGARVDASGLGAYNRVNKDDKSENGMSMIVRLVPTFALDAATIGLDVAFAIGGESKASNGDAGKDNWSQIGFGAFVQKGLGSGSIKAGLSYTLPPNDKDGKANGSGVFQIPIILEYAFF